MKEYLQKEFSDIYKKPATGAFFSPGRVNLIGEHIDYNGGLVMPCAITFGTSLLTAPNSDGVFRLVSLNFDERIEIPLQPDYKKENNNWYNYPLGVIQHFAKGGHKLDGLDLLFDGNIPIALNELFNAGYSKLELVKMAKSVENNFIGVNSGIMDQFAVAFGEKDKALMLNCDTLYYEAVDSNLGDHVLAIINTNKPRKLAESKYNERVTECATALKALQQELDISNLCDIDSDTFEKYKHLITDKIILNRATHVIEENDRVKLAAKALASNNLAEFGKLMYASHFSLRDLYEELDTVVEYAQTDPNVAGARMTGAGFGGCAIALVKADAYNDFAAKVSSYYLDKVGYEPSVYSSLIGDGVGYLK
jgi:galactokinase